MPWFYLGAFQLTFVSLPYSVISKGQVRASISFEGNRENAHGSEKTRWQNTGSNASLSLTDILDALRDPIRREIVRRLSKEECLCASFADLGSPSGLSYHFTCLRTAGLTNTRKSGTCRLISLRKAKVDQRFVGLLSSVLKGIELEARTMDKMSLEAEWQLAVQFKSRDRGTPHHPPERKACFNVEFKQS